MPPDVAGVGLAVFDLDGTVTRHDTLMPFVLGCLARRPWRLPRLLLVPPLALHYLIHRDRGRFKGALIRATLGGLTRAALERCAGRLVPRVLRRGVYAEALEAIAAHRRHGDRLLLLSASVDLYVPLLAQALGIEQTICTRVRWRSDGRLDGRLATANCRGEEKRRCLQALLAREPAARVTAYGNDAADLPHLRLAHEGYLVNASPRLPAPDATIRALHWSRRA
ncbi:MAG TPA: HAD-IB family hydrolase [Steroidobacteraceae bacterium]